jgi:dephospho-CoA kinase
MIVAITGYIGTGKTTTALIFKEHGYRMIEVDSLGHELLKDPEIRDRIRSEFGVKVLDRSLGIDRKRLGQIVFNDPSRLAVLNRIVHPYLKSELKKRVGTGDVVIDCALYNELEVHGIADKTVLVVADIEHVYQRLYPRFTQRQVLNIMNSQTIAQKPDFIIENNGTLIEMRKRTIDVIGMLKS